MKDDMTFGAAAQPHIGVYTGIMHGSHCFCLTSNSRTISSTQFCGLTLQGIIYNFALS